MDLVIEKRSPVILLASPACSSWDMNLARIVAIGMPTVSGNAGLVSPGCTWTHGMTFAQCVDFGWNLVFFYYDRWRRPSLNAPRHQKTVGAACRIGMGDSGSELGDLSVQKRRDGDGKPS